MARRSTYVGKTYQPMTQAQLVEWLKKQDGISDAAATGGDVSFTFWDGRPVVLHCRHE